MAAARRTAVDVQVHPEEDEIEWGRSVYHDALDAVPALEVFLGK
jgi:hypothetical protein